jgi:Electron transfer DM13
MGMTRTSRAVAQLAAFAGVVLALVAGLLGLGRISDNATLSMGLTAAWFGVVFVAVAVTSARRRHLVWPLAAAYGSVAIAALVLVIAPTLIDREVNERVVRGTPVSRSPQGNRSVELAAGRFGPIAHDGRGRAAVVELPDRSRLLTLTDFETDPGPDLRVYLSSSDPAKGELGNVVDLGALKGNVGDQQYSLPPTVEIERLSTVVVWCRAFSVAFTSAPLRPS